MPLRNRRTREHSRLLLRDRHVQYGQTPLHRACARGQGEIVYLLLECGADATLANMVRVPLVYSVGYPSARPGWPF